MKPEKSLIPTPSVINRQELIRSTERENLWRKANQLSKSSSQEQNKN